MTRRAAMTTTEVLVALFIMALGVIAILTMFPLGMLNMANALRDDRTAQAANTADGFMRSYWKSYVVENQSDTYLTSGGAFDNPGVAPPVPAPGPNEPSYPVFVDPIGIAAQGANNIVGYPSGPPSPTSIPRRSLMFVVDNAPAASRTTMALRVCSMTDGITYSPNGTPDASTGSVERDMRYNWLWVLQRPVNKDVNTATMQVVVFERRAPRYYNPTSEQVYSVPMNPTATSLTLPLTSGVQKGNWIMDCTCSGSVRQAIFYRVSSATDNGGGQLNIELESPIRRIDGNTNAYTGTVVVMIGVADVFTRPNLTP